jgi:hypothetical protein
MEELGHAAGSAEMARPWDWHGAGGHAAWRRIGDLAQESHHAHRHEALPLRLARVELLYGKDRCDG